jgi:hypothetical protein
VARAAIPMLVALAAGGCYLGHERALGSRPHDAGIDAQQPPMDDAAPRVPDAPLPSLDAPPPTPDAPPPSRDAGHLWRDHECATIGMIGPSLNGEPCIGPFACILDCHCSGSWVSCTREGRLSVAGRCDPAACAVPGAWDSCARYLAEGGAVGDRCDPRFFGPCTAPSGACTRTITCQILNGWVEETTTCP